MRVTIWDLDYYYSSTKVDCFNPDVMKISSYHKQLGDEVNFVLKEDDIFRPYDLYYIIKEQSSTPNPPFEFFTNSKVRWWGKAVKFRINWKMDNVMLGVRPDYLLYPEKETKLERAEQIRLLGNEGKLLPISQDWTNSFKNKKTLVTDTQLWTTDYQTTINALKQLEGIKNISFLEPIWLHKMAVDREVMEQFLKLKISPGALLNWVPIFPEDFDEALKIWIRIKKQFSAVKLGPIVLRLRPADHWISRQNAIDEWNAIQNCIIKAKENKVYVTIQGLSHRTDTPYFFLFETATDWLNKKPMVSWLEWITIKYGPGLKFGRSMWFWSHTEKWSTVFRDLLRQTWENKKFLTIQWGKKSLSDNDIPWLFWKQEFRYEI